MAIAYVAGAKKPDTSGASTASIDTTGANLIVGSFGALLTTTSQTDSKSNTYLELGTNADYNTTGPVELTQTYVASPTVGSGHTSSIGVVFTGLVFAAFSGAAASPFDQTNYGTVAGGTSCSTGSVTPTEGGELIVSSLCVQSAVTGLTAPAGYTLALDAITGYTGSTVTLVALAYKIKTAGDTSAENPSWSWTGSSNGIAKVATFKAAASQTQAPRSLHQFRLRAA